VPAVWRYAGRAARADGDMLVSLQFVGPQPVRGMMGGRRLIDFACLRNMRFMGKLISASLRPLAAEAWSLDIHIQEESQ
jgi:hypothetical protein